MSEKLFMMHLLKNPAFMHNFRLSIYQKQSTQVYHIHKRRKLNTSTDALREPPVTYKNLIENITKLSVENVGSVLINMRHPLKIVAFSCTFLKLFDSDYVFLHWMEKKKRAKAFLPVICRKMILFMREFESKKKEGFMSAVEEKHYDTFISRFFLACSPEEFLNVVYCLIYFEKILAFRFYQKIVSQKELKTETLIKLPAVLNLLNGMDTVDYFQWQQMVENRMPVEPEFYAYDYAVWKMLNHPEIWYGSLTHWVSLVVESSTYLYDLIEIYEAVIGEAEFLYVPLYSGIIYYYYLQNAKRNHASATRRNNNSLIFHDSSDEFINSLVYHFETNKTKIEQMNLSSLEKKELGKYVKLVKEKKANREKLKKND